MALIEGPSSAQMEVDAGFKAARTSIRPPESLGWLSVGAVSGALTGLAANAPVFSFRNLSGNPIMVRRVGIGFVATTGFTTAQLIAFGLMVARAFSASDSGGTAITLTGSNCKHRTSMGTLSSVDCRIAAAAALTAGTRTLDANFLSMLGDYAPTTAGRIIAAAPNNLFGHDPEDYPLILAQNEGFIIANGATAFGAAGVGSLFVNVELAEATSF